MNTFTDAERAELVAIGKRMDAAAKLPTKQAAAAFAQLSDESRALVMRWVAYRITGKDPKETTRSGGEVSGRDNGKVSARVEPAKAGRKIQKGTV